MLFIEFYSVNDTFNESRCKGEILDLTNMPNALKNLGSPKPSNDIKFKVVLKEFFDCSWRWILGCILASLPVVISFILLPVESMTVVSFFNNVELIYVSVTMAVIAFCDGSRKISGQERALNSLVIIIGVSLYGMLKGGVEIPILAENGLHTFNKIFLIVVIAMGLLSYLNMSFDTVGDKNK